MGALWRKVDKRIQKRQQNCKLTYPAELSLSGAAFLAVGPEERVYVGSSSGISMSSLLSSVITQNAQTPSRLWSDAFTSSSAIDPLRNALQPPAPSGTRHSGTYGEIQVDDELDEAGIRVGADCGPYGYNPLPPGPIAESLVERYFAEIGLRFPFLHKPTFIRWHTRRAELERMWGRNGERRITDRDSKEEIEGRTWLL